MGWERLNDRRRKRCRSGRIYRQTCNHGLDRKQDARNQLRGLGLYPFGYPRPRSVYRKPNRR